MYVYKENIGLLNFNSLILIIFFTGPDRKWAKFLFLWNKFVLQLHHKEKVWVLRLHWLRTTTLKA